VVAEAARIDKEPPNPSAVLNDVGRCDDGSFTASAKGER